MTLKINMAVDTDESGNVPAITGRNVNYVDATTCGDERQAIDEAMDFMEKFEITRLKMRYGTGIIELHTGDNRDQKTEELFHASCCFDLSQAKSFSADEFNFGNPNRACDVAAAAHSALRIAKRFDRKVSFMFNNVAVPAVEPKKEITTNDIRSVLEAYTKAQATPRFSR